MIAVSCPPLSLPQIPLRSTHRNIHTIVCTCLKCAHLCTRVHVHVCVCVITIDWPGTPRNGKLANLGMKQKLNIHLAQMPSALQKGLKWEKERAKMYLVCVALH